MATKITDKEKMLELYKKGLIHKSTYYRGLKRGYIIYKYKEPHNQGGSIDWLYDEEKVKKITNDLKRIFYRLRDIYNAYHIECDEMVQETLIYLYKRQEPIENFYRFLAVAKSYMKTQIRGKGKKEYKKKILREDFDKTFKKEDINFNELDSLED
jgi:hypothetical protein